VLGISKRTLMDSYRRWEIPCVRVGKHVRFRTRALEHWIDANEEG
jgi:excisionase family DNA binding protein